MGYDRGDSIPLDFESNGASFGSKSKEKLSPRSYPIQFERNWKYSFVSPVGRQMDACCYVGRAVHPTRGCNIFLHTNNATMTMKNQQFIIKMIHFDAHKQCNYHYKKSAMFLLYATNTFEVVPSVALHDLFICIHIYRIKKNIEILGKILNRYLKFNKEKFHAFEPLRKYTPLIYLLLLLEF